MTEQGLPEDGEGPAEDDATEPATVPEEDASAPDVKNDEIDEPTLDNLPDEGDAS